MFIGPFMVCDFFAYKLYENYVKELKIKAKTNKLFKMPLGLAFYSLRQRVSWSSEADLQYPSRHAPLPGTALSVTHPSAGDAETTSL